MANIFSCLGLIWLRLRHRCWSRGIFRPLRCTILIKNKSLAQQWPRIILAIIVLKHGLFKSLDFLITPLRWHAASSGCRGLFIVLNDCWGVKDFINMCLIHHFPLVDIHSIPIFFLSIFIRIFFFIIDAINIDYFLKLPLIDELLGIYCLVDTTMAPLLIFVLLWWVYRIMSVIFHCHITT